MPLPFCTSERLPSKLALNVYASKMVAILRRNIPEMAHTSSFEDCDQPFLTFQCHLHPPAIYGNSALSSYMWSCFFFTGKDSTLNSYKYFLHLPLFSSVFFPLLFSSISALISFNNGYLSVSSYTLPSDLYSKYSIHSIKVPMFALILQFARPVL